MSTVKKFRVISSMKSEMNSTGQQIFVFELAEINYAGIELPSGYKPYTFKDEGDLFILDYNSSLSQAINRDYLNSGEILALDMNDFRHIPLNASDKQRRFFHTSVKFR